MSLYLQSWVSYLSLTPYGCMLSAQALYRLNGAK